MQFKHGRGLRGNKIIQHAQRADDHAAEQKSAQVDRCFHHLHQEHHIFVACAVQFCEHHEQRRERACKKQNEDHADYCRMCF